MHMKLEAISPKKAADWLKLNINNRPLSQSYAKRIAEAITDGQWQVNGDPIRFDASGNLTDGQHRLTAIIKAGVTVQSWVLRGLDSSAFDTIDRGHKRSNSDILARRGEINYTSIAAGCNMIWIFFGDGHTGKQLRPDQMDTMLAEHGARLRKATEFACHHKTKMIPVSEVIALMAWANHLYGDGSAEPFWEKVLTAQMLKPGSPEHLLFKRLSENMGGTMRITKRARMALCVKAFNSYILGETPRRLSFDIDKEAFPEFVTPKKGKRNA